MNVRVLEAYTRVFVEANDLDTTSTFYQGLLGGSETLRFAYPEAGLRLAAVSSSHLSVLIIAGSANDRRSFEATRITIRVEALEQAVATLLHSGAAQLEPIQVTPAGRKTRFRHADGLVVEYVENEG